MSEQAITVRAQEPRSILSYEDPAARFKMICGIAAGLRRSNLLPEAIKTDEQAAVVMLYGDELGLKPMQSFDFINIVEGKPGVNSKGQVALARFRCPGIKVSWKEISKERCTISITRPGEEPFVFSFTWEMASNMQCYEKGQRKALVDKWNWRSMPVQMMVAMTTRTAFRMHCPDLTGGLPSTEELEDGLIVDASARVVEAPEDMMPREVEPQFTPDHQEPADVTQSYEPARPVPVQHPRKQAATAAPKLGGAAERVESGPTDSPATAPETVAAPFPEDEWRKVAGMANLLEQAGAASAEKYWLTVTGGKDAEGKPYPALKSREEAEERIDRARSEGRPAKFIYVWAKNAVQAFRPKRAAELVKGLVKAGLGVDWIEQTLAGGEDLDLWILRDLDEATTALEKAAKMLSQGKTAEQIAEELDGANIL